MEDRDGEQKKPPIIQEEIVNDLLCHLDTYKSMKAGWNPRVLRELAEELAKPLSMICQQSWLTGEVPDDWRITSVTPIYKAKKKIPELQACLSDLGAKEDYGVIHLECAHWACEGQ